MDDNLIKYGAVAIVGGSLLYALTNKSSNTSVGISNKVEQEKIQRLNSSQKIGLSKIINEEGLSGISAGSMKKDCERVQTPRCKTMFSRLKKGDKYEYRPKSNAKSTDSKKEAITKTKKVKTSKPATKRSSTALNKLLKAIN